jgi:hypothetical protein
VFRVSKALHVICRPAETRLANHISANTSGFSGSSLEAGYLGICMVSNRVQSSTTPGFKAIFSRACTYHNDNPDGVPLFLRSLLSNQEFCEDQTLYLIFHLLNKPLCVLLLFYRPACNDVQDVSRRYVDATPGAIPYVSFVHFKERPQGKEYGELYAHLISAKSITGTVKVPSISNMTPLMSLLAAIISCFGMQVVAALSCDLLELEVRSRPTQRPKRTLYAM